METFTCPYFATTRLTQQGLHSHIEQNKSDDDADSSDDSDSGDGLESGDAGARDTAMDFEEPEERVSNILEEGEDDLDLSANPPQTDDSPIGSPFLGESEPVSHPRKCQHATVEEVEDEDERHVQDFLEDLDTSECLEKCKTYFQTLREKQRADGNTPWYPFESEDEWELAQWLMTSGLSQKKTDDYLKLKAVCEKINPSFANNQAFLKFVDALPPGPQWYCHAFELVGDELDANEQPKKETVKMWYRDPVECVRELLGNPLFAGKQGNKPICVYKRFEDRKYSNQEFTEMWTAQWWWNIQELPPRGSTLVPIIISTDKTQLTRFSGDQQAWPVYLTIGNIEKETRRSMDGVKMDCADGFEQRMFPILTAYIADYPEQCLVACCQENSCPRCLVQPKQRGEPVNSTMLIVDQSQNKFPIKFWSTQATTGKDEEIDCRLRHFTKGISLTSQWTGNERKNMEKVFLGILAQVTEPSIQRAVAAIIDFIYYAHFETHCDESLAKLDAAWAAFHNDKSAFIELGIRKHFDINKLHKLKHYVDSICSRSTADGFNTENTEHLHIDFAKASYRVTNKVRYTQQMTVFGTYLQWAVPSYIADPNSASADNDDDDGVDDDLEYEGKTALAYLPGPPPDDPGSDDEGELDDTDAANSSSSLSYRVPKNPSFPHVPVTTIVSEFHAPNFLIKLDDFLESNSINPHDQPDDNSTFPVYKRLAIPLPNISEVTSHVVYDTIRAVRGEQGKMTMKGVIPAKEGRFDTVLVRKNPPCPDQCPTDGIAVARIQVIFRLPVAYGSYPHPLAYVEWYKPLKSPVPNI
ncbi:hypothetical protein B0H10DRAFT_2168046 [Mycena sp. CBHHK59/15]|nr:hypothetical protein B0H10DRAFT_2168046 [Mycena sp. CBHHK59/15]